MRHIFYAVLMMGLPQMVWAAPEDIKTCLDYDLSHEEIAQICARAVEEPNEDTQQKSELYDYLGYALYRLNRYEEAEGHLKTALEYWPENNEALSDLGWLYWQMDRYPLAVENFEKALGIKHTASAMGGLASAFSMMEIERDRAVELIQAARILKPDSSWYATEEGWIYLRFDEFEQSKESFKATLEAFEDDLDGYLGLGVVHSQLDEFDEAIENLNKFLAANPDHARALVEMAYVKREGGDAAAGLAYADQALEVSPGYHNAILQRAHSLLALGRGEEGRRFFMSAYEGQKDNEFLLMRLNYYLEEVGAWQDMAQITRDALARGMTSDELYVQLTFALLQLQENEQVVTAALEGEAAYPEEWVLPYNRAYALFHLKDRDASLAAIKRAAELGMPKEDLSDFTGYVIERGALGLGLKASRLK